MLFFFVLSISVRNVLFNDLIRARIQNVYIIFHFVYYLNITFLETSFQFHVECNDFGGTSAVVQLQVYTTF